VYVPNVSSVLTYVSSLLSECGKSRFRCCIYMHVASICFQVFQVFHMYVCKCFIWMLHMFAMVFKYFSNVFVSVSYTCFKCFVCFFYVANVASGYLKSRLGCCTWDAREKRPATWATFGAARVTSEAAWTHCWYACSCRHRPPCTRTVRTLAPGRPGASRSI
jgi:hypothetical protein